MRCERSSRRWWSPTSRSWLSHDDVGRVRVRQSLRDSGGGSALQWFLADGATHSGFELFYLLQNPWREAPRRGAVPPSVRCAAGADVHGGRGLAVQRLGELDIPRWPPTDVSRGHHVYQWCADRRGAGDVPGRAGLNLRRGARERGRHGAVDPVVPGGGGDGAVLRPVRAHGEPRATPGRRSTATYLLPNGTMIVTARTPWRRSSRFNIWVDYEDARLADTAVSTTVTVDQRRAVPGGACDVVAGDAAAGTKRTTRSGRRDGDAVGAGGRRGD